MCFTEKEGMCLCVRVHVCVRVREREREFVCVCGDLADKKKEIRKFSKAQHAEFCAQTP